MSHHFKVKEKVFHHPKKFVKLRVFISDLVSLVKIKIIGMKTMNPFFVIGTIGMVVTSLLHIVFAYFLSAHVHSVFLSLYPVFIAFLAIGFGQILNKQRTTIKA